MRYLRQSIVLIALFLTSLTSIAQYRYRYWFDTPATIEKAVYGEEQSPKFALQLNASALEPTLHTLSFQIGDGEGGWCDVRTAMFMRIVQTVNEDVKTLKLYVDQKEYSEQTVSVGQETVTIDLSDMSDGLHYVNACLVTSEGYYPAGGGLVAKFTDTAATPKSVTLFVDGQEFETISATVGNMTQIIDIAMLPKGLHVATAILETSDGNKYPVGGSLCYWAGNEDNNITAYRYWLNEDDNTGHSVMLNPSQEFFTLQTMLDVPQMPFSSMSFSCVPAIDKSLDLYADNIINWMAYSGNNGNAVFTSRRYTDIRTKVHVENDAIEPLPRGERLTAVFKNVCNNSIGWKRIEASIDAEFTIKGGTTCYIDMFNQAGSRVWSLSSNDFKSDTTYVFTEARSYYIGVHDAPANVKDAQFSYSLTGTTGIEDVTTDMAESNDIDYSMPYEVYNLNGIMVGDDVRALAKGFYIIRQAGKAKKITIN